MNLITAQSHKGSVSLEYISEARMNVIEMHRLRDISTANDLAK